MRNSLQRTLLIALCLVTFFARSPQTLNAQAPATEIYVNYSEVTETEDGLGLNVYFTLVDYSKRVVTDVDVQSAALLIDEGNPLRYEVEVNRPTTPSYIALVLDASGSMSGAAAAMRAAASDAVTSAPQGTYFAVIGFNDEIQLLTGNGFSTNREDILAAIESVQPINNRGTCLFDASYQAIEMLSRAAPNGRRAAVVFTDGVDQKTAGSAEPCSTHTEDDVVALASRSDLRVPIHTIGMRGSNQTPINEAQLRNIANITGGLSAIGDQADLGDLFKQIMDAVTSQWLVESVIHPEGGLRTATILLTLSDGTPLRAVATFEASRSFALTPTATPTENQTATPYPVDIEILGVRSNTEQQTVVIEAVAENEEQVSSYRVELKDATTNNLQGDGFIQDAPLPRTITLPVGSLPSGQYAVLIRAFAADERILASSSEERFSYILPTPTPSQTPIPQPTLPTSTPVPQGAVINNVQFNDAEGTLRLYLTLHAADTISQLRVELVNSTTNQLVGEPYFTEPSDTLNVPMGSVPRGDYTVVVISQDASGTEIERTTYSFGYTPATPTPSPTPVETSITLGSPRPDDANQQLIFPITVENEGNITQYVLEFIDSNNFLANSLTFDAPPYDSVQVALTDLGIAAGDYTIVLKALGSDGEEVSGSSTITIRYTPPQPTPVAASGTSAEADSFPSPGYFKSHLEIVLPILAVLIIGLIAILIMLLRKPSEQMLSAGFEQEFTRAIEARDMELDYPTSNTGPTDPDATNPVPQFDPEATNPIPQVLLPPATLTIERTRDTSREGESVAIRHVPFTIGRRDRDLTLEQDDNVSRRHAEITFHNGTFYLTDLKSLHGTTVNGTTISFNTPTPIVTGDQIKVGMTTVLMFKIEGL